MKVRMVYIPKQPVLRAPAWISAISTIPAPWHGIALVFPSNPLIKSGGRHAGFRARRAWLIPCLCMTFRMSSRSSFSCTVCMASFSFSDMVVVYLLCLGSYPRLRVRASLKAGTPLKARWCYIGPFLSRSRYAPIHIFAQPVAFAGREHTRMARLISASPKLFGLAVGSGISAGSTRLLSCWSSKSRMVTSASAAFFSALMRPLRALAYLRPSSLLINATEG